MNKLLILLTALLPAASRAQTIAPTAVYTDAEGTEQEETTISAAAPLTVTFKAHTEDAEGWTAYYELRIYKDGQRDAPWLTRHEEETTVTFTTAGTHHAELWATFIQGTDTVAYTDSYYSAEGTPITIEIAESKLEMPNAFSPNGDGINDIYKAKEGWQSIIAFKAVIFNRWGQKIYSWTDPNDGWDGTWNGKDVAEGVYFVNVEAKGADGKVYHIRRDVNLLRGYSNVTK